MPTTVSSHSGAGRLSLMSCVSESSPPQDSVPEYETEKIVSTKRKFWNPRKWFKRKCNKGSEESPPVNEEPKETLRSRSTSELSVSEEQTRRRSGTPMHPGLSVSHDSIFHSPQSGSELELDAAQSSSSLSISHQPTQQDIRLQTELSERLRLRRIRGDTSEDDEGLPRSPCNSPTTTDSPLDKTNIKDHPTKSHSTCSDGSLLSMGSSEMDEDSSFGQHSRHSSKLSLHEKRPSEPEIDSEWGLNQSSAPLNHSAAHHKVSIRPKRTHGAPRRRRVTGTALPTTPEVNEDTSVRSLTPDSTTRETVTELYTSMSQQSKQIADAKLKCSSLPPGLAGPGADGSKLSRSRSNAGSKSQDPFTTLEEEETDGKKSESSFFGRIFPRRSGKKKKAKEEKEKEKHTTVVNSTTNTYISKVESNYSSININYESFENKMITVDSNLAIRPNALRSGPVTRQRMQPIDIPESPNLPRHEDQSTSPLQAELENHFKNKMATSPTKVKENVMPEPSSPLQFSMSPPKTETRQYTKFSSSRFIESSKVEESKSKVRIAGLSSLQQKVLSLNDEEGENGFKSLTNLPTDYEKPVKPITKSHSFKTSKSSYNEKSSRYTSTAISEFKLTNFKSEEIEKEDSSLIFKSISLDSVKNPDEKIVESVNEAKVESKDSVKVKIPTEKKEAEENKITITGPSHKAIVNISSSESHVVKKQVEKEQQISVTKIEVKQESKTSEFFNVQLNKKDAQTITKTEEIKEVEPVIPNPDKPRKFSNDNIEVIKKEEAEKPPISKPNPLVTITPMGQPQSRFYKKHSESMKRSMVSVNEKPMLKVKSNSFDCPKSGEISPNSNKSSQNSLDKIETKSQENLSENVVLRRKSLIRPKQDEEPELMKVFARRSLKLKDSDSEALSQQVILTVQDNENTNKSRDSDKENLSDSSPMEERKNSIKEIPKPKEIKIKEPLIETKFVETTEVTLRKPINNKLTGYQRTVSLHPVKSDSKILKQISVVDRPKTDAWYLNKNQSDKEPIVDSSEIISNISEKSDIIEFSVNPKNFTQRKAEWEKRAQESIRKTVP